MSDTDGTCEYVLDLANPKKQETEDGEYQIESHPIIDDFLGDTEWTCPHNAEKGEDRCIFHLPIDKKGDREVVEKFQEVANNIDRGRKLQFIGAKFGDFELIDGISREEFEETRLNLSYSKVDGVLDWSDISFDLELRLSGIDVIGDASFQEANFLKTVDFNNAIFQGDVHGREAKFSRSAQFGNATFGGRTSFKEAEFKGETNFQSAKFEGSVSFRWTDFEESSTFKKSRFIRDADFYGSNFKKEAEFRRIVVGDKATFTLADFSGETSFRYGVFNKIAKLNKIDFEEEVDFREVLFESECELFESEFQSDVKFSEAVFRKKADIWSVEFRADAIFTHTHFKGKAIFQSTKFIGESNFSFTEFFEDVDFSLTIFENDAIFTQVKFKSEATFQDADFNNGKEFSQIKADEGINFYNLNICGIKLSGSDLTGATLSDSNLQYSDLEETLLSRASLFGADLRGTKLSGAVLGDVRIDEDTQFLGHPSDDGDSSPHTLSAIRSRPTCVYDPNYEEENEHEDVDKAKSVYRALEELGGKHARPRLQARSFVRRQDLQKDEYKRDAKEAESWEERLIAGARWSRARVARATLLYGESPWRVIAWSFGIIFSFALLYPLGGWMKPADGNPITYAQIASNPVEILNSVYYSTLTYTALGFGDFQPVGLGRLLTTVETGLGAVMLALLVFILGRRAAR